MSTIVRVLCVAAAVAAQAAPARAQALPPALAQMVEAERAFAAAAREKGIRDAFLEYFAEDARFDPAGEPAKAQLRRQKPQPFSERELVWEPRTGDVAASGELGWLTGPGTFVNHLGPDRTPRHTNYLSVWRREPGGPWRVLIDVGTDLDRPAAFAPGFTRAAPASRYAGGEGKAAATASLRAADQALNERLRDAGAGTAYVDAIATSARLHRDRVGALTDAAAIRSWHERHARGMSAQSSSAEAAASGDLGYTYGTWRLEGDAAKPASYLRLWTRDASGRWLVAVDVLLPPR